MCVGVVGGFGVSRIRQPFWDNFPHLMPEYCICCLPLWLFCKQQLMQFFWTCFLQSLFSFCFSYQIPSLSLPLSSPSLFSLSLPPSDRLGELERDKARLSEQLIAQQREHLVREMDILKRSKSKNLLKKGFKKLKGKIQVRGQGRCLIR